MAQGNNIDDLFKQKLAGREVAYSEGGWAGAQQLLDKHYKMLFWKKLGLFLLPAALLAGGLSFALWPTDPLAEAESSAAPIENTTSDVAATADLVGTAPSQAFSKPGLASKPSLRSTSNQTVSTVQTDAHTSANSDLAAQKLNPVQKTVQPIAKGSNSAGKQYASASASSTGKTAFSGFGNANSDRNAQSLDKYDKQLLTGSNGLTAGTAKTRSSRKDMQFMPWSSLLQLETPAADIVSQEKQNPAMRKSRKLTLHANGGLLAGNQFDNTGTGGWNTPLGGYGGLHVQYHIYPKVSLGLGANAHSRASLQSEYAFGEGLRAENSLAATYLDCSFDVRLKIIQRHSLGFGVAISPLLNVYKTTTDVAGSEAKAFNRSGFAEIDAAGMFYYQFAMTERWNLDATFRYGLFDLTDDQYFKGAEADDRNHQLRLGVSYLLLQR